MGSVRVAGSGSLRLDLKVRHRIGTLAIDVSFELRQPWTVLFGPSGSGKSTILRAIAGLVRPDSGRIAWSLEGTPGGRTGFALLDSDHKRFMPAHTRWIPLAPQAASLFPHKTVIENVGYAVRRTNKSDAETIAPILELFRIAHLAGKMPSELSGGEAQRVNLARAAAATIGMESGLLLLDEPFAGLDLAIRSELMLELQVWAARRNLFVLSVTHGIAEAFQLHAEVIKLADGKVVERGPVEVVLAEERKRLLAQLNGAEGSRG